MTGPIDNPGIVPPWLRPNDPYLPILPPPTPPQLPGPRDATQ